MEDSPQPVKVTFDLPRDLMQSLRAKAEEEDRSVSAELRRAVRQHVSAKPADQHLSEAA